MAHLYIMCGLAFAGKSTLARKIAEKTGAKRIGFDDLWNETNKVKHVAKNDNGWKLIRKIALKQVESNLRLGKTVIYDDNNPRFDHREEFRKLAEKLGISTTVIFLNIPLETIRKREEENKETQNRHQVDPDNFNKVAADLEAPTRIESYVEFTPETNLEELIQKLK